ncbi:MAG: alpha/beta hydrolase fold domain-containing protein [Bacteroidales bacterium]|nr:alpha/beta hydrolase fold domain-containing protein [Bacteroidales bacterium]
MKRIFILLAAICLAAAVSAQEVPAAIDSNAFQPDESVCFAVYDTLSLEMDFYFPTDDAETHPCIIYSYGGGFINDNQRHFETRKFCRDLAGDGFVVIASNYRLGLKGVVFKGVTGMVKPLENAIQLAAEDVMKVTRYAIDYASELTVDPNRIILIGSSAGAITSLQCDYERCNRTELAARYLPEGFRYAGVVSFAGAIFTRKGIEYVHDIPAPTLFLHGTADRLVTYSQIKFFGIGFYGSDRIVRMFKERHYPHKIIRFTDEGHTVAARYFANYDDVMWFIRHMVMDGRHYEIDETFSDPFRKRSNWDNADPNSLYK